MLTFIYTARDPSTGKQVSAEVEADSESAAAKLVSQQGLSPIDIKLKAESESFFKKFSNRVKVKDRILFSRQLATLINAGLPITQSLRTVSEQTQSQPLRVVISKIIADVEAGNALAAALSKHPKVFNEVYISLVAAGEASGTLDEALERIATQQEKDAAIIAKVRGALVYPLIVVVVIIGVVIFMLTTVLPQVELLYEDLNRELPFLTSLLLSISRLITRFWWAIILGFAAIVWFINRWRQTKSGRSKVDRLKMNVPLFKRLFMKMYMARFCRTGTTLTSSGVPLLEMMRISGRSIGNVHIRDSLTRAAEKVKGGTALSESIKDDPNFLPLVPQMLRIGEQSGNIDSMLDKTATFYEEELDNEVKAISTTIEPVLMVVLALTAGLMVGAILLPVYGLVGDNLAL